MDRTDYCCPGCNGIVITFDKMEQGQIKFFCYRCRQFFLTESQGAYLPVTVNSLKERYP